MRLLSLKNNKYLFGSRYYLFTTSSKFSCSSHDSDLEVSLSASNKTNYNASFNVSPTLYSTHPIQSCCQAGFCLQSSNSCGLLSTKQEARYSVRSRSFSTSVKMNFNAEAKAKFTPPDNLGCKVSIK